MMIDGLSRKRKWDDFEEEKSKIDEFMEKKRPVGSRKWGSFALDMELQLEARRCIDIQQSREEVDSFDARTNERACNDSTARRSVSLNLELNLQPYNEHISHQEVETASSKKQRPSVIVEEEEEEEEEEMVATVCTRCHMLVMLCVSRPWCPNCKFLHPKPDQFLFKLPPKCTSTAQLLC